MHGAEDRLRRAVCRARLGDAAGQEDDVAWVHKRLADLPLVSRARYQLALSELALFAGDGEGALAALNALPEGWREDPDLTLDTWLAWQQAYLAHGQTAEARAAGDEARALAAVKGFTLRFRLEGDPEAERASSAAPALLARTRVFGQ